MREASQRKTETRQRILDAAGALFRQHGIDAVGVDAVMHAAGLTHGGFYAHFASKEALVSQAAAEALARSAARWERVSQDPDHAAALAKIVGAYLDPAHIGAVETGCVLPALGPEVARRPEARAGITDSIRRMLGALDRCRPDEGPDGAMAALSCMVGAVLLARLSDDNALAEALLSAAKADLLSASV